MSGAALSTLDSMSADLIRSMAQQSKQLLRSAGKKQLGVGELNAIVKQSLTGELKNRAQAELRRAVKSHEDTKGGSQSARAGIVYPVGRIHTYLKYMRVGTSVKPSAAVALAATVEQIVQEVLQKAEAQRGKEKRITPHHIQLAIDADMDLHRLLGGSTIARGGVTPHIESALVPKKRKMGGDAGDAPAAKKARK